MIAQRFPETAACQQLNGFPSEWIPPRGSADLTVRSCTSIINSKVSIVKQAQNCTIVAKMGTIGGEPYGIARLPCGDGFKAGPWCDVELGEE